MVSAYAPKFTMHFNMEHTVYWIELVTLQTSYENSQCKPTRVLHKRMLGMQL